MILNLKVLLAVTSGVNWIAQGLRFWMEWHSVWLLRSHAARFTAWKTLTVLGRRQSGDRHSHFQWLFTTYLGSQTMHVVSEINWEIWNTCQCVHLRMSFELGVYLSISIHTQQDHVHKCILRALCWSKNRRGLVFQCTVTLLAFSRAHQYLVKVSSCCVFY